MSTIDLIAVLLYLVFVAVHVFAASIVSLIVLVVVLIALRLLAGNVSFPFTIKRPTP